MSGSGFLDGLALAATLVGDRGGEDDPTGARSVGLAADLAKSLERRLSDIRAREGLGRERALASIAASLRPPIDPAATMPARAAALLAPEVPRSVGVRWMSAAPLPRPGYRAPPALRATLRRYAYRSGGDPERTRRDRGAGRAALCHAMRSERAPSWKSVLALLPDTEAAAVIALDALPGEVSGEGEAPQVRARCLAFLTAALDAGEGSALTEALGAMERGAREHCTDRGDRWARAGREIEELRRRPCPG